MLSLQKIEKSNRQQVRLTCLMCVFALIAVLCCILAAGLVYSVLPEITSMVTQMQSVLSNLEDATAQLSVLDFSGMVSSVEDLVATAQTGLEETIIKLNTIDFDALNQAIEDLAKVIEPLKKVMNVFR